MVAAPGLRFFDLALQERRATELTAPDDQRIVQQAALLKVFDQRRGRRVGIATLDFQLCVQIAMLIPTGVHQLDKPHAAFARAVGPSGSCRRTIPCAVTSGPYMSSTCCGSLQKSVSSGTEACIW